MKQQRSSLIGKKVFVTRPKRQAKSLVDLVQGLGGEAVELPTIKVLPPKDSSLFEKALLSLRDYDWVIVTSVNGVRAVAACIEKLGISPDDLTSRKLGAIGPATGRVLAELYREADLIPKEYVSDAFPDELGDVSGKAFLLPRADIARKNFAETLRERGATVTDVAAYSIVPNLSPELVAQVREMTEEERPDYFMVTSSSTARGLISLLKEAKKPHWINEVTFASIGPITAKTVEDYGIKKQIVAKEYTIDGLVEALLESENCGIR